jgi:2-polyprenyl-3-methyl-5-hydroxy-6-metoxy-1,4-benzoquinol methylase
MAGVRLGVFQALAGNSQTGPELAAGLQLDEGVLELLLRTLVFAGYLSQRKNAYELSPLARRTMIEGGRMELFGYVLWNYQQWEMVAGLEETVRSGRGCEFHKTLKDPEAWRNYQRGMLELARLEAPAVARWIPVPAGSRSLLDVAGSHGLFGAAICRRHPPMRSTVLDLSEALPYARELAVGEGIGDVVEHRAASLLEDDWGAGHDVVLFFNILHHFAPEQNCCIVKKAAAALRPDGVVAVWELERPRPADKVTAGDAAALYFALTSGGGAYHAYEFTEWLNKAGFRSVRIRRPKMTPGKVLITARAR